MKVAYNRSSEWLKAEQIRLGRNLNQTEKAEVDPASLSEATRAAIVESRSGYQCAYPDTLDGIGSSSVGKFFDDMHPEDVTPETIDRMVAEALAAIAANKGLDRASREAREEEKRQKELEKQAEHKEQSKLIAAFTADPAARPDAVDCSPRYWIRINGSTIRKEHPEFIALCDEVELRHKTDDKAKSDAEIAKKLLLQSQIAEWVQANGTDSQRARFSEGLLPDAEVTDAIKAELLSPGEGFAKYAKITAGEVKRECGGCDCDENDVEFEATDAFAVTDYQYQSLLAIRAAFPGAEVTPRIHTGTWDCGDSDCPLHEVTRYSARVHVAQGEIHAVQEYAI
jgi:hypothetical protein